MGREDAESYTIWEAEGYVGVVILKTCLFRRSFEYFDRGPFVGLGGLGLGLSSLLLLLLLKGPLMLELLLLLLL